MSIKLRELIRNVRACKTAADERAVIAKECALIRTAFKERDNGFRHRNVAKLLYIHMLGYPTHFGQMESLKLIASPRFPEKRIGYLGLMILLDERQEVLMLVTNSLKNDFYHPNAYVVGLALASMGNIASSEMARDLAPEIEKLFRNSNPYIRKKACITAVRVIRKVPETVEDFVQPAVNLLNDKNHAVLLGVMTLMQEIVLTDPKQARPLRKLVPLIVKLLKNLVLAGYVSEYDVCGITDPFLQCKILQLLRLLGTGNAKASDEMNDILAQVAINTESSKNPGNAILYECVQTIMAIEAEQGLRVLAINILGRFLVNRDNNIRYVALNTLCKAVHKDTQAIQRHRNTVVDCLKDADISIRRRALDLIYALVTKGNVKPLVKELLNYLKLASGDHDFKSDLTDKICLVVERYAPSKRWHIDMIVEVLAIAGSFAHDAVPGNLVALISRTKSLHTYSVHKVYHTLLTVKANEHQRSRQLPLVHVAMWVLGEYGQHIASAEGAETASQHGDQFEPVEEDVILDLLEEYTKNVHSTAVTRSYILNALVKLSNRFEETRPRILKMVKSYSQSMDVELQQRSVEYSMLLNAEFDAIQGKIIGSMPAIQKKKKKDEEAAVTTSGRVTSVGNDDDEDEESFTTDDDATTDEGSDDSDESADEDAGSTTKGRKKASAAPSSPASAAAGAGKAGNSSSKPAAAEFDLLAGVDFDIPTATPIEQPLSSGGGGAGGLDLLGDIFGGGSDMGGPSSNTAAHNGAPAGGSSGIVDPLDLLMGGASGMAPPPQQHPAQHANANAGMDLMGMGMGMGMGVGVGSGSSAPAPAPAGGAGAKFPTITVFEKAGASITFSFKKPSPEKTQIRAAFSNATASDFASFDFKVAVPKYIKLRMKPASSSVVPANSQNKVTQLFELENTMHRSKKLLVRIRIDYAVNGVAVSETAQVSDFPAGI